MDILAGLKDKLRFIERFYDSASRQFVEVKRKIDVSEEPFDSSSYDPDTVTGEPSFLDEWLEADESLNLVGQAALTLVQNSLKEYIDGFMLDSTPIKEVKLRKGNWFQARKSFFLQAYAIDWDKSPIPVVELEEINLARNDIQHTDKLFGIFGLTRRQNEEHRTRFPRGLFVHEIDRQLAAESADASLGRIYVTKEKLREAIRRVERFCEYLEENRPY
jgi:hypothetical protein